MVSKLYSRSVGGAGEVELLDRRHLRALKVSCGWWRPGHVTPVLASDWSPCPGSVRHHPCAGLHLCPHPGRAQPSGLPGQLSVLNLIVVKYRDNNICAEVFNPLFQGVRAALLSTQGAVVTLPYCFLNTEVNTVVATRSQY